MILKNKIWKNSVNLFMLNSLIPNSQKLRKGYRKYTFCYILFSQTDFKTEDTIVPNHENFENF